MAKKKNENLLDVDLTKKQKSHGERAREIELKGRELRDKRKAYLEERDINKAYLSESEIQYFINVLKLYSEFEFQVQKILIEMLKYPIPELSITAEKFINENMANTSLSSLSLWINMFTRQFLPNNALRLLIKHYKVLRENGGKLIFPKPLNEHLENEKKRMVQAKRIEDEVLKNKQISRVQERIDLFNKLLELYS